MTAQRDGVAGDDLRAAASGDERAFARIVRAHEDAVYRLLLGQTGDPGEARDLTQETFLRAFRYGARLTEVRSLRAWLSRVALNLARDWRRRRVVRRWIGIGTPIDPVALSVDNGDPPVEEAVDARDALAETWRQIARLPQSIREPLLLCAVEGMSQAEAAEVLGISIKAVELRVRRGRRALADLLATERPGGTPPPASPVREG